jgi:2-polyprenyl-3-methyl-5-hydroxy-6-metoxy-1,4-benzoquinol methylase
MKKTVNCCICCSDNYKKMYTVSRTEGAFDIVKCECGHIYQNPRYDDTAIKKSYNRKRDFYRSLPRESNTKSFDFVNAMRLKRIGVSLGRLLDIGCAFGNFLCVAKKQGFDTYGIEIDKNTINVAKKCGKIFAGTLENAKYNSKFFDVVTMFDVIEHVPQPSDTLKEVKRIMKKGGMLVIQTPASDSLYRKIKGENWDYYGLQHLNYFSKKDMKIMLEKNGFAMKKIFYGDEIGFIGSVRGFLMNKENNGAIKFILMQIIRRIHFGNVSFGAKVYYATKN